MATDDVKRVALVTGASSGIGAATALLLARRGYAVGVNYHHGAAAAQALVAQIEAEGGAALALPADVTVKAEVQAMVSALVERFGGLDLLVANAGTPVVRTPLLSLREEDWDRCVDINLKGVFLCAQAAGPHLLAGRPQRGAASVVIVGSAAVYTGGTESGHYAAAKAGAHALVRPLAKELAPTVAVNCVAPGFVDTPFHDKFFVAGRRDKTVQQTPLQRAGRPEEIAAWIAYVAEAPFVTGQVFHVNGGIVMP